jgi:hypothetical protein
MLNSIPTNAPHPHDPQASSAQTAGRPAETSTPAQKPDATAIDPVRDVLERLRLAKSGISIVNASLGQAIQRITEEGADSEHRSQVGFHTKLAYVVQDLEKFGGQIAIAPELRTELSRRAATVPGLENERMQTLLRSTPEIADRRVVHDIRSAAREIALLADQHAPAVESRIDVLENRVRLAPRQTAQQQTSQAQPQDEHATANVGPAAGKPRPAQSTLTDVEDRIPPANRPQKADKGNTPPEPVQFTVQDRPGFAIDVVLGKMRPPVGESTGRPDPAYTPLGDRLAAFEANIQAERDERAFERADKSGRAALDALNAFTSVEGASILNRIRDAAKQEPGGMSAVLSEMREGGRFADLRKEFNNAFETQHGFAAAYNQAANAVGRYAKDRDVVQGIIESGRHDANLLSARFDRLDAKIGEDAEETPGRYDGENMLKEMADKVAEILHRAIDQITAAFTRNPSAHAAPSPSMGA